MARTTAQAFSYFLENHVLPTAGQRADVTSKRSATEGYLRTSFPSTSDMPLLRVVLIGSADRGTHIQPVDDVDVLAQFSNENDAYDKYRYTSSDFLQRIRRALDASTQIKKIGARGQAVRLFYVNGAHVDIAPVFKWVGDGYALPAGDNGWTTTNPEAQAAWLAERKRAVGSNLGNLIRLAKAWNDCHSGILSSFHLEVLVASMFSSVSGNHRDGLKIFFDSAMNWLAVSDPAGHSGDLSSYLTWQQRDQLRSRLKTAHDRSLSATAAEARGDHAEGKRLWRIELGDRFPLG